MARLSPLGASGQLGPRWTPVRASEETHGSNRHVTDPAWVH